MSTIRIAVASTPVTATLEAAVPAAIAAIEEAGRLGAMIVCLPETGLPGHRDQPGPVQVASAAEIEAALAVVADAARRAGIAAIVGAERPTPAGREIVSIVFGADGTLLGEQVKTQIDPGEERDYVAGEGRRIFEVDGLVFGIAICHEAYRYPEITRSLVHAGARVVFVPHYVTTNGGPLPTRWCDPSNPYNEQAIRMRAIENSIYVASANAAGPDQGSVTGVIGPGGELVASLDYGAVGVLAVDIDLDLADRAMARRWAPERSLVTPVVTPKGA